MLVRRSEIMTNFKDAFGFFNKVYLELEIDDCYSKIEFPEEVIKQEIEDIKDDFPNLDDESLRSQAIDNLVDAINYWIIYYQPDEFYVSSDIDRKKAIKIALKCDLIPFYYEGRFLLALAGCGMDLSPKLDAFQVFMSGTIDKDSLLFRDKGYFENVVGNKLTKEITEILKCSGDC